MGRTLELTLRVSTQDAGFTEAMKAYRDAIRALHREAGKPMGSGRRRRPSADDLGAPEGPGFTGRARGGRRRQRDTSRELDEIGSRVHHTGLAMERASRRGRDALMAIVGPTLDYERTIVDAMAVTGDALGNKANQDKLRSRSRSFADLGHDATSVSEAIGFMGYAGLKTDAILGSLRPTLDLARAGSVDLAKATDIGTDVMTAFGMQARTAAEANTNLTRIANVATYTFTSANTNLELYARSLFKVGALAPQVGLSLESVSGAIGALGSAGIKGAEGGTAMRNMLLRLANPKGPASDALKEIGLKASTLNKYLAEDDLPGMLNRLNQALDGLSGSKRTRIIDTIFGNRTTTVSSYLLSTAKSGVLQTQIDATRRASTGGETGIAAAVAKEKLSGAAGKVDVMKARLAEVGLTLGQKVLPQLLPVAEGFLDVAESFGKFAEKNPEFVQNMAKLLVGMTATTAILGPMTTTFGGVIRGGALLTSVLGSGTATGGTGLAGGLSGLTVSSFRAQGAIAKLGIGLGVAGLLGAVLTLSGGLGTAVDRIFGISDKLAGVGRTTDEKGMPLAKERGTARLNAEEAAKVKAAEKWLKRYEDRANRKEMTADEAKARLQEQGISSPSSEAIRHEIEMDSRRRHKDRGMVDAARQNLAKVNAEVMKSAREREDKMLAELPAYLDDQAKQIDARKMEAARLRAAAETKRSKRKKIGWLGGVSESELLLRQAEHLEGASKEQEASVQRKLMAETSLIGSVDTPGGRQRQNWRSQLEVKVDVQNGTASIAQDGQELLPGQAMQIPGVS